MKIKYEHWEDYYKNEYSEIYKREYKFCSSIIKKYDGDANKIILSMFDFDNEDTSTSVNANNSDAGKLIFSAGRLFDASCHLLDLLLRNNGYFQLHKIVLLKHAFFSNLFSDGDKWTEFLSIYENDKTLNLDYVTNFIFENLYIFKIFNNKMKKMLKQGLKISKSCKPIPKNQRDMLIFLRINVFNEKYKSLEKYKKTFTDPLPRNDDIYTVFKTLLDFYGLFCKLLKSLLKQEHISAFFPKNTIKLAQEKNIINNSNSWFLYIEYMNVCLENFGNDKRYKIMSHIIKNFKPLADETHSFINNKYSDLIKNLKPIHEECLKKDIHLSENKPVYGYKEWGINEKSYNIIIEFLRSHKELKNVWVHGSRAFGTNAGGSDLDFIVDYPADLYEMFKADFIRLKIPYLIDCSNINSKKNLIFIKETQYLGTKKIYCSEDFN